MEHHLRHQGGCESLEEERQEGQEAGEVGAQASAKCQQAAKQSDGREEEGDEVEGKGSAAQVVVLAVAGSNVSYRTKVALKVKRQSCRGVVAASGRARAGDLGHGAEGEEGPGRDIWGITDATGVGTEEVELLFGRAIHAAGKDDEELEEHTGCEEDEGHESDDGTWGRY